MLVNFILIFFIKPNVRKTLKINFSGYKILAPCEWSDKFPGPCRYISGNLWFFYSSLAVRAKKKFTN